MFVEYMKKSEFTNVFRTALWKKQFQHPPNTLHMLSTSSFVVSSET